MKRSSITLDKSWSGKTFKNGLPYYGVIKVLTGDKLPSVGVPVEVCAQAQYLEKDSQEFGSMETRSSNPPNYCSVRVSDENGFVTFELINTEPDIIGYEIKVIAFRVHRHCRY